MGIARATAAHGGLVLVREQYGKQKPSQEAYWADTWLRRTLERYATAPPTDAEGRAHRDCVYAVREIQFRQINDKQLARLYADEDAQRTGTPLTAEG
jgi:hypothetical protein